MSEVHLYSAQASMEHFSQLRLKHKEQNFWSCFLCWKFHNQRNIKLQSRDSRDVRQDGTVIIIINPTRQTKLLGGVYTYTSTTTVYCSNGPIEKWNFDRESDFFLPCFNWSLIFLVSQTFVWGFFKSVVSD